MIKVLEISTSGYKNLTKNTIRFDKSNLLALIAPNNFGKSNFLESVDFANNFIQGNKKNKYALMNFSSAIPINKYLAGKNFCFSIKFEALFNSVKTLVLYDFEFLWSRNDKKGAKIVSENLRIKENVKGSRLSTLIKRDSEKGLFQPTKTSRCSSEIEIENDNLIINKLELSDRCYFIEIIKHILSFKFSYAKLMEVDSAFSSFAVSGEAIDSQKIEMDNGFNVSKFLYELRANDKNDFQLVINSFKDLIPSISEIVPIEIDLKGMDKTKTNSELPFTLPEKFYNVRITETNNNQPTGIKYTSRGTQRILLILATAIQAKREGISLLAFEELENAIHPSLMQRLLMILAGIIPDTKILITSHSPYLVQYLPMECIYLALPNEKNIALFARIKNSKFSRVLAMASSENLSLGDFLFELMINDENESSVFGDFFEVEENEFISG